MAKRENGQNCLPKGSKTAIAVVLLLIILVVFAGILMHKSPIYRKLTGSWNIEYENSYIARSSIYEFTSMIITFEDNDSILLPFIADTVKLDFKGKTLLDDFDEKDTGIHKEYFDQLFQKRKGTWKITSINPDSVFIDAPQNPLHGKYAIRFFIDENGFRNMRNNIYKMALTNDSTYLICNKGEIMLTTSVRDWEGKN